MNQHLQRYDSMVSSESEVDIGEFENDDILESRNAGHSRRKKTRRELFQELLDDLESAEINKSLGMASFVFACCSVIFGVCYPLEHIDGSYRMFAALTALFLLNNSFFIVKTIRERELIPYENRSGRVIPDFHFIQGALTKYPDEKGATHTPFTNVVLFGSFFVAIAAFAYGLWAMDAHMCIKMFLAQGVFYMWSSSLNFAMMLRDKFEAKVWAEELEGRHIGSKKVELACQNVMNTCRYHQRQFQVVFFLVAVAAILMVVFVLVHWLSEEDKDKGIGLFTAAMFMCMSSSWNLARVLNSEKKIVELSVMASFVIAIVLSVVGLMVVKFDFEHKLLLILSLVILVDATFNFAKVQHRVKTVNKLVKVVQRKFHMEMEGESPGGIRDVAVKPQGGTKAKKGGH